jgi:drug/metabolite transporter (DMT)-like permease
MHSGLRSAVLSGTLAATAGLFGKLGMSPDFAPGLCRRVLFHSETCDAWGTLGLRGLFLVAMVVLNSAMIPMFVAALHSRGTSVEAVAINSGVNFVMSGILGALFLAEVVTLRWMFGIFVVLVGLVLIASDDDKQKAE